MASMNVLGWPAFNNRTGNPYNRLLYSAMEEVSDVDVDDMTVGAALGGRYDVLHVHWPDDFLSFTPWVKSAAYTFGTLGLLEMARLRGTKVVWTAHDLGPHESYHEGLETEFWRWFPNLVDGLISLSESGLKQARHQFPELRDVPSRVVPHGHYRPAYPEPDDQAEARASMGLHRDAPVLLYVGRIRPYKNVPHLVRNFRHWSSPDARLIIAGEPSSRQMAESIQMSGQADSRIRLDLRFLPEATVVQYLAASNVVVLPYDHILHSGTALLALSFNRPVMVPARGAMQDLRRRIGRDWVYTYEGLLSPKTLRDGVRWALNTDRPNEAPLGDLEWSVLARQTVDLYRETLSA